MRSVIVGGGTGGHIYPALAVATSLRDRPDAPELRWIGGHRGLEADLVPPTGIPFRRLAARSLRTTELDAHVVLDPVRLGVSVPQAAAMLARERPAAIFTTGGYVAIPVLLAAAPLGIPVVLWDGSMLCRRHPQARATHQCTHCSEVLCDECVHRLRRRGGKVLKLCPLCSHPCERIGGERKKKKTLLGFLQKTVKLPFFRPRDEDPD